MELYYFLAHIFLSQTQEPAKPGTCARDRCALQQLFLNVHVKNSDLTCLIWFGWCLWIVNCSDKWTFAHHPVSVTKLWTKHWPVYWHLLFLACHSTSVSDNSLCLSIEPDWVSIAFATFINILLSQK